MSLTTDLAAQLYTLAARVQSGALRPWQCARIASALAPELDVLARIEATGTAGHVLVCQVCAEAHADMQGLAAHVRDAHGRDLSGRRLLRAVG